jgi:hypothetical protein
MKLAAIAQKLDCTLDGDPNIEITGVAGIEEAQPSELTFLSNRKYRPLLASTRASAIIVASHRAISLRPKIRTGNSSDGHRRKICENWRRRACRTLLFCGRGNRDRIEGRATQLRHDLSRCEDWR